MGIIEWHKNRWKERRVTLGYFMWLGVGCIIWLCWILGIEIMPTWFHLIFYVVLHFFGAYLVFRYHLFAIEVNDDE